MPICPQITNTPITVTYNSTDYTLDSVQDVQTTTTTFYAAPTPSAQAVGDIWYDTSNGNKQYRWDGSSWVLVQDTAIPAATTAASTAQSTASSAAAAAAAAQADATTAIANATTAIANAATANATATTAAYNAGVAQSTANGKNTTHYSTGSPSGGGTNGDIWFTVNGGGTVLYQYVYNSGSWVSAPISNTVIANLDAGKINAGTITGIAYNNGSGTFSVSPSGVLVASSATITGTVYASAGTFTGTVTATSGSFNGTVTATSGSFTGDLYSSNGTIGGFSINSGYLSYGSTYLNASSGSSAGTYCIYDSSRGIYLGGTMKANAIDLGSYGWTSSGTITAGIVNSTNVVTATITGNTTLNLIGQTTVTGNLQVTAMASISATGVVWSSSNNRFYLTTSTERHKDNITPIPAADYLSKIFELEPVTFNYKPEFTDNPDQVISGLIAEKVAAIPEFATTVNLDKDGLPESIAYDRLAVFFIPALKQLNDRLTKLEAK